MPWSQAEIDTLKAAIASSVLSVAYADRTVTYKSTDDMLQALALMEREVQGSAASTHRLAATSKGV